MSFPKLTPHVQAALERQNFHAPLPIQEQVLAPIKSGADILCLAPERAGKSTALVISVVQALKSQAKGEAPRAIIFVKDKEAALSLEETFKPFIFRSDLRMFSAYDQHELLGQRDTIYDGVDILIGTPARLSKLFLMNGINLAELRMMIIDDADFLAQQVVNTEIIRMVEAGHKFQKIIFSEGIHPRLQQLVEVILSRPRKFKLSD